jgi:ATP synthase protein I
MEKKKKNPYPNYLQHFGMGFQILAMVLVGVLAGQWLDKKYPNDYSLYTIIASLLMIIIALYQMIKQFLK